MPSLGWQELVIVLLLYGAPAVALIVVLAFRNRNRTPYEARTQTSLSASDVLRLAREAYVSLGYQVASESEQNVTFTGKPGVNASKLLLASLLGLIPGIAYFFMARREFLVTINAIPRSDGTFVSVMSTTSAHGARTVADEFLSMLPAMAGNAPARSPEIPDV